MKKTLFFLSLLVLSGLGCGGPQDMGPKRCNGYDCTIVAETIVQVRQQKYLDCNNNVIRTENVEYEGNQKAVSLLSVANIKIDRGEFQNLNNGSTTTNISDSLFEGDAVKQKLYVSGFNRTGTLRLEKGANTIHYKYLLCWHRDSQSNCTDWHIQEEGDRTILAFYSKVLDTTIERKAKCANGNFIEYESLYDSLDRVQKIVPAKILEVDFGKDLIR